MSRISLGDPLTTYPLVALSSLSHSLCRLAAASCIPVESAVRLTTDWRNVYGNKQGSGRTGSLEFHAQPLDSASKSLSWLIICNDKSLARKDFLSQLLQIIYHFKNYAKNLHNFAMWLTTVSNSQFLKRSAIWEQQLKAKFMIRSRLLPETLVYSNAHCN